MCSQPKQNTCKYKTERYAVKRPSEWASTSKTPHNLWLSCKDISDVLEQYQEAYPCFTYIYPSYIDYDTLVPDTNTNSTQCVTPELCAFSVDTLISEGKKMVAIVFNLAKSTEKGSHWVCVFIHLIKREYIYFDSLGHPLPSEIMRFYNKINAQRTEQLPPFVMVPLLTRHQYGNNECGIYCLFAIALLLTGKRHISLSSPYVSWELRKKILKKDTLDDLYIKQYRRLFFS